MSRGKRSQRTGSIVGLVAIALLVLLGCLAASFDVGRVVVAAQRAQDVADAAAYAAMMAPPSVNYTAASERISQVVAVNGSTSGLVVTNAPSDIIYYAGGQSLPGYGLLGLNQEAVTIYTHVNVPFMFAPALGLNGTVVTRKATCAMIAASGSPFCPMWVSETTPFQYGQLQNLLAADGPHYPGIPGNFGWLQPNTGAKDFDTLLSGYNVPPETLAQNYVEIGDIINGLTGVRKGQWDQALGYKGTGRLARAAQEPWANDTFTNYRRDNPRIMIVPICEYLDGSGANAEFEIVKFGVWWLESMDSHGNDCSINARFIQYISSSQDRGDFGDFTGIWTSALIG